MNGDFVGEHIQKQIGARESALMDGVFRRAAPNFRRTESQRRNAPHAR